ncbi:hypothetical protein ABC733_00745 [Mangrovibacter sp. SLW1]
MSNKTTRWVTALMLVVPVLAALGLHRQPPASLPVVPRSNTKSSSN